MKLTKIEFSTAALATIPGTLQINTVVMAEQYPKLKSLVIDLNANNVDTLCNYMIKPGMQDALASINTDLINNILTACVPSRNGTTKPNNKSVLLSNFLKAIRDTCKTSGIQVGSEDFVHTIAILLAGPLKTLGCFQLHEKLTVYNLEDKKFLNRDVLIQIMYKAKVAAAFALFDYSKFAGSEVQSLAVISHNIVNEIIKFRSYLIDVGNITQAVDTTLSLLKLKLTQDTSALSITECDVLRDPMLSDLAANYSFVTMCLSTTAARPNTAHYMWPSYINDVINAIKSSNEYAITDFNAIKAYFSVNVIRDDQNTRKIIVISKNVKNSSEFVMVQRVDRNVGKFRVLEYVNAKNLFEPTYLKLNSMTSKVKHQLTVDFVESLVDAKTPLSIVTDVDEDELSMLAASCADGLQLSKDENGDFSICYFNNTKHKNIVGDIPAMFDTNVVSTPSHSLVFVSEDLNGEKYFDVPVKLFEDMTSSYALTETYLWKGFKKNMSVTVEVPSRAGSREVSKLNGISLSNLLGYTGIEEAETAVPTKGIAIYTSFMETRADFSSIYATLFPEVNSKRTSIEMDSYTLIMGSLARKLYGNLTALAEVDMVDAVKKSLMAKLWENSNMVSKSKTFSTSPLQNRLAQKQLSITSLKLFLYTFGFLGQKDLSTFDDFIKVLHEDGALIEN